MVQYSQRDLAPWPCHTAHSCWGHFRRRPVGLLSSSVLAIFVGISFGHTRTRSPAPRVDRAEVGAARRGKCTILHQYHSLLVGGASPRAAPSFLSNGHLGRTHGTDCLAIFDNLVARDWSTWLTTDAQDATYYESWHAAVASSSFGLSFERFMPRHRMPNSSIQEMFRSLLQTFRRIKCHLGKN
jgi:hypothetical protein